MSGCRTRLRWNNKKQSKSADIPADIASWLFDPESLTARLIANCNGRFSVKVLSVKRCTPTPDEIQALKLRHRSHAIIRQVLLYCDDTPWVYARTVIPMTSLRGALQGLVKLGSKHLGAVLFADKTMRRSEIEVTVLNQQHPCYSWTGFKGKQAIWGRRSVFRLSKKPLLVSEFFLPDLFK
ncbi:MAG: chorismate lyase [Gammaproteobacteria bacterium]|nr:chorismate lyase [Gammaproteobacteria bacterium]